MSNYKTKEDVFKAVQKCLADSLVIAPEEIELTSRLTSDLGADSLDFLDIIFSLERIFGVNMMNSELETFIRGTPNPDNITADGFVTLARIRELALLLPALSKVADQATIKPQTLFSHITTESIVILVHKQLSALEAKGQG